MRHVKFKYYSWGCW